LPQLQFDFFYNQGFFNGNKIATIDKIDRTEILSMDAGLNPLDWEDHHVKA
jgi:hypothetical protein